MAEVLGPMTLANKALPTGVDGTRLSEWAMRDGITYGELVNQVALALGDVNQQLASKWGFMFSLTEELAMEYGQGGSVTPMDELTDIDTPVAVHGTTIGHMLPLHYYGQGIGGSKRYWWDARSATVRAGIKTIVDKGIWRFEQVLLNRFFSNSEETIGSAGYSVPFVRGTGGVVDFAPPSYDGATFATSHNHYIGYNLSTPKTMADVLEGLAATLAEHGHASPFQAIVSRADIALFNALANKVLLVDGRVTWDRGGATSGPQFIQSGDPTLDQIGSYQSSVGLINLMATNRLPTGHVGMTKSYGQLDGRNALAVRVHPNRGFGLAVIPETTPDDDFPIKQLDVDFMFGIGVGADRTNGAAGFLVAGGTWVAPTVT